MATKYFVINYITGMFGAQWAPPGEQSVQDGDRAETATTGGGGDAGHIREGFPRLRGTDEGGDRV